MAKKATAELPRDLALRMLTAAAIEPGSKPLFGTKAAPGLFGSSNEASKQAVHVATSEGWIEETGERLGKGKTAKDLFRVSAAGMKAIKENTPTVVALRSVSEVADRQLRDVESAAATLRSLEAGVRGVGEFLRQALEHAKPRADAPTNEGELEAELVRRLASATRGDPVDLPTLYRHLTTQHSALTLGGFHDRIRAMWDARRIELLPYTRAYADIAGHRETLFVDGEVMYYVYPAS